MADEAEAWVVVRVGRIRCLSMVSAESGPGPKSESMYEQDRDLSRGMTSTGPGSELGQGRGGAES